MPVQYPAAQWRPLGPQTQGRIRAHDIICLHTMVGSLDGTDRYFRQNGYGGTESHFGVGHDGTTYQWQDLEHTADANLDGNGRCISIETADMGAGFPVWDTRGDQVPAWTAAQVEAIARLVAWLCARYRIPCELIPDSRPGRRGVGWHRLGVDPWRVDGGERWSSARGKVCPGDRRIAQIPAVVARARQLLNAPPPRPNPPEDDMFTDADRALLQRVHHEATLFLDNRREPGSDKPKDTVLGFAASAEGRAARIERYALRIAEQQDAILAALAGRNIDPAEIAARLIDAGIGRQVAEQLISRISGTPVPASSTEEE